MPPPVLIVNDNPVNLTVLEAMLTTLGYDVRLAENGAEALERCLAQAPGAVLMDIDMPVMGGLEATRQLRSWQRSGRLPPFPVIAVTARCSDADRAEAAAAGMSAFLAKPWTILDLVVTLQRGMDAERAGP